MRGVAVELHRSVDQLEQDVRLLRVVASALAVRYRDTDLARQVDELADALNLEVTHQIAEGGR
jgi:hypothetical protein